MVVLLITSMKYEENKTMLFEMLVVSHTVETQLN